MLNIFIVASFTFVPDIDECQDYRKNLCPNECINTPGSFTCNCSIPGYLDSSTDKFCQGKIITCTPLSQIHALDSSSYKFCQGKKITCMIVFKAT